jgi:hypothetical protein
MTKYNYELEKLYYNQGIRKSKQRARLVLILVILALVFWGTDTANGTEPPVCTQDSARGSDKFEVPGDINQQDANDLVLPEGTVFCVFGGQVTAQTGAIYGEADGVTRLQDYLPNNPSGEKPDVSHYVIYQTPEEPWENGTTTTSAPETTTTTTTSSTTTPEPPSSSTTSTSEVPGSTSTELTEPSTQPPTTLPYTGTREASPRLLGIAALILLFGILAVVRGDKLNKKPSRTDWQPTNRDLDGWA